MLFLIATRRHSKRFNCVDNILHRFLQGNGGAAEKPIIVGLIGSTGNVIQVMLCCKLVSHTTPCCENDAFISAIQVAA